MPHIYHHHLLQTLQHTYRTRQAELPQRGHGHLEGSSEFSRPPPPNIAYEPPDINGSPRPGTLPRNTVGAQDALCLLPLCSRVLVLLAEFRKARLTIQQYPSAKKTTMFCAAKQRSSRQFEIVQLLSIANNVYRGVRRNQDYDQYGPAPTGRQERRRGARQAQMAKKEVRLINGELILECKIPTILYSFLPRRR
jgi:chitin synthase